METFAEPREMGPGADLKCRLQGPRGAHSWTVEGENGGSAPPCRDGPALLLRCSGWAPCPLLCW